MARKLIFIRKIASATPVTLNILVVAGGGGGGGGGSTYANGGGGGAGGVISNSSYSVIPGSSYSITVGTGGTGGANTYSSCTGINGSNSIFNDQTAIGGGGANGWSGVAKTSGGSGGGGAGYSTGSSTGASGTAGQGNAGGNGTNSSGFGSTGNNGGGGGGATAVGSSTTTGTAGGNGGAGYTTSITGSSVTYGGGGGGGGAVTGGAGGTGGGANGGSGNVNGSSASANTGGGGGGAGAAGSGGGTAGGSGGSGIVTVSYPTSSGTFVATGTYTSAISGSNTVVSWTSGTGTFMILSTSYVHSYSIVTDHTQAGTADTSNFKVTVSLTLTALKTVANGGSVQNTTTYNGQTVPADVVFSTSSSYSTLMNWGVESYDPVNGILVAHVLLPTLHHSSNDTFYMGIGNGSISTYQGGALGSFLDSNTVAYLPLPNGSTLSALDYTSNGNNGTIVGGVTATSGRIGGAASFNGSSGYVSFGNNTNMVGTTGSISFWIPNKGTNKTAYFYARNPNADQYADLGIVWVGGNLVVCVATNASTNWAQAVTSYSSINNGDFLVFTFNSSNLCTCYQNGVSIWSYTFPYSFNNNESGAISTIARGGSFNNYYFDGVMDDFMYRSDNPSTSWITARYNNDKASSTFLTTTLIY